MLDQELNADIEERQTLLLQIKTLYLRYDFKETDEQFFLNFAIPAIYAIWEGFIQTSFQIYVQQLNQLNLNSNSICKPLLVYHMENTYKQFNEYPQKQQGKVKFYEQLNQFYQSEFIEITRIINTKINVGFDVLKDILQAFNLEPISEYIQPAYPLKTELDNFLLRTRNSIAHGQNSIIVSREDLNRAILLVEMLMDLVQQRILSGFENKSYLHDTQ